MRKAQVDGAAQPIPTGPTCPVVGRDGPALDHLDPGFARDPYPTWAQLRDRGPLWWWEETGAWVVLAHDLAAAVLRDDEHFSPSRTYWRHYEAPAPGEATATQRLEANGLFHVPHEDHLRLRRLVMRAFTPRGIEAQRPYVEAEVDRLLGGFSPGDELDAAAGLAEPLPPRVIGHMLGVPAERTDWFKEVTDRAIEALDPAVASAEEGAIDEILRDFEVLLTETIAEQREHPDSGEHNLLLRLLEAEADGDRLSEDELVSLVVTLLMAGSDTTVHAISLGALDLLSHPDQRRALLADPGRFEDAVTELLRHSYIGHGLVRFARSDTVLADQPIRAGDMLFVNLGAAHHDSTAFADPEHLDLDRDLGAAFPFGVGSHYCIGAALARLEVATALRELFVRFPGTTLAGEPTFGSHFFLRGLTSLPVLLG